MKSTFRFGAAAFATMLMAMGPAMAQTGAVQQMNNGAQSNTVPGGITLVPGTVVTPRVSGSSVTGTVPLAGTVGAPGVPNYNPGMAPNGNSGALYPVVPRTDIAPVLGNQTSLPQSIAPGASPTLPCPSGAPAGNGC